MTSITATPRLAVLIATAADNRGLWQIGEDVYRAPADAQADTFGLPLGARWECLRWQFDHYRTTAFTEFSEVTP